MRKQRKTSPGKQSPWQPRFWHLDPRRDPVVIHAQTAGELVHRPV
jgi:hypothetical protein